MRTKCDLKTVANQIAELSGGTISNQKKFEGSTDEYYISNVTEEMLVNDLGFEFKGYISYGVAPYYEKGNIMCYFDDVVLHVMETTYSALDKVSDTK